MVNSVYLKNLIELNRSCKTKHQEMMAQLPNLLSFLEYLENHFIKSLHFSHVHGQLCSSQRRVLVIILGNKIRINKRFIQNWCPISPTNVLEALLRGSNRFSPKLFITTKMDL